MTRLWFGLLTLMVACSIGVSTGTAHGMALSRLPSAQLREQGPPPRIGFLALTRTEADPRLEGLRQGLAQLGSKVTVSPSS